MKATKLRKKRTGVPAKATLATSSYYVGQSAGSGIPWHILFAICLPFALALGIWGGYMLRPPTDDELRAMALDADKTAKEAKRSEETAKAQAEAAKADVKIQKDVLEKTLIEFDNLKLENSVLLKKVGKGGGKEPNTTPAPKDPKTAPVEKPEPDAEPKIEPAEPKPAELKPTPKPTPKPTTKPDTKVPDEFSGLFMEDKKEDKPKEEKKEEKPKDEEKKSEATAPKEEKAVAAVAPVPATATTKKAPDCTENWDLPASEDVEDVPDGFGSGNLRKLGNWKANETCVTDHFAVAKGKWMVEYLLVPKGSKGYGLKIKVMNPEGGEPVQVIEAGAKKADRVFVRKTGTFYLAVESKGCEWRVRATAYE